MNKRKAKLITELALTVKVTGKQHGKANSDTQFDAWNSTWDRCEYAHMAVQALLGDTARGEELMKATEYNEHARFVMQRLENAGVQL